MNIETLFERFNLVTSGLKWSGMVIRAARVQWMPRSFITCLFPPPPLLTHLLMNSSSNLLLGQAQDQRLNQSRLEAYLSSSQHHDLDLSNHLNSALSNGRSHSGLNGTNTPKDLSSRIKILELFTLHVLPRNEEWDYAKSFIANSDILDEERREAFLQTLQELQEVSEERDPFEETEEEVFEETEEEPSPATPSAITSDAQPSNYSRHQRTSSEVDYGIEKAHPNGLGVSSNGVPFQTTNTNSLVSGEPTLTKLPPKPEPTAPAPTSSSARSINSPLPSNRSQLSPPTNPRHATRKPRSKSSSSPPTLLAQAQRVILALSALARNITGSISRNPTALLRFLIFVTAFLMAVSQKQVRERVKRITSKGWDKVKATVGMGTKVSYI